MGSKKDSSNEPAPEATAVLEAAKQPMTEAKPAPEKKVSPAMAAASAKAKAKAQAQASAKAQEKPKAKPRPARPLDRAIHGRITEILKNQRINNSFVLRYRKGEGYVLRLNGWIKSPIEGHLRNVLLKATRKMLNGEHLIVNF